MASAPESGISTAGTGVSSNEARSVGSKEARSVCAERFGSVAGAAAAAGFKTRAGGATRARGYGRSRRYGRRRRDGRRGRDGRERSPRDGRGLRYRRRRRLRALAARRRLRLSLRGREGLRLGHPRGRDVDDFLGSRALGGDRVDQPRQFRQRVFHAGLRRPRRAQATFELLQIDFGDCFGFRAAHQIPRWLTRSFDPAGSLKCSLAYSVRNFDRLACDILSHLLGRADPQDRKRGRQNYSDGGHQSQPGFR